MKVKSISLKIVLIGLLSIALCFAGGTIALAGISKGGGGDFCKLCHTGCHKTLKKEYQGPEGCVNCHSSSDSSTTYTMTGGGETVTVPVVHYTGVSAPTTFLAGGNFWWVAQTGGDSKGHNVLGIAGLDPNYAEAPGNVNDCSNSCHYSLATTAFNAPGCEGCHMTPAHHADDSNIVVGGDESDTDGYYRFLSGHMSGNTHGVCGIEDSDWQATKSPTDHNEYSGFSNWTDKNAYADKQYAAGFYNMGHTMSAFCFGCHGNYHIQNEEAHGGGRWTRHPSDWEIPNSGEYAKAFGANGTGTGTYDPDVPLARPAGPYFPWTGPESTVVFERGTGYWGPIGDMVMCISCHRPHGSPYPKMLRWDMTDMGQPGEDNKACSVCHTNLKK